METTFRDMFSNGYTADASQSGSPFHSLFTGVVAMGQVGYMAVFTVAIIAAVIACSVIFFRIYISNSGKEMTEQKTKLTVNLGLVFFLVILGWLVVYIYQAFLW